ncbi:MAG: uncharacterized protein K0R66_1567 [Gammaproteobacteria bacterium]|jgi:hypothetical protein|nr:uncharacterized protein [Gammaproteobacteria bacterium]
MYHARRALCSLVIGMRFISSTSIKNDRYNKFHPFDLDEVGRVNNIDGRIVTQRVFPNICYEVEGMYTGEAKFQRKIWDGGKVTVHDMGQAEIDFFKNSIEQQKEKNAQEKESVYQIRKPLFGHKSVDFSKLITLPVLQHEYAIATASSSRPILGAYGAGPCVVLAVYNNKLKKALLAHIDSLTDLSSLKNIIDYQFEDGASSVAHIVGGDEGSIHMTANIINLLKELNITIDNADIISYGWEPQSLAIDARTGQIYSPVSPFDMARDRNESTRLAIAGLRFSKTALRGVSEEAFVEADSSVRSLDA